MQINNKTKVDDLRFIHYDFFYGEICMILNVSSPIFPLFSFLPEKDLREICQIV